MAGMLVPCFPQTGTNVLRHEEKAFSGFIEAKERPEGKATEGESKNTKTMKNPENEQ
jgi:hypothetical protein